MTFACEKAFSHTRDPLKHNSCNQPNKKPLPRSERGFAVCIYAQRFTAQAILFKWSIRFVAGASLRYQCQCKKPWRAGWRVRATPMVTNQLPGKPAGEVSPKTTSSAFARDVQGVSGAFVVFRLPHVVCNYLANLKAQPPG